jgi:hypothetical protein
LKVFARKTKKLLCVLYNPQTIIHNKNSFFDDKNTLSKSVAKEYTTNPKIYLGYSILLPQTPGREYAHFHDTTTVQDIMNGTVFKWVRYMGSQSIANGTFWLTALKAKTNSALFF